MRKTATLFLCLSFVGANLAAQHIQKSSSQILSDIKKLNVLGNVLYWAAHPDDENTRLIAYFSNHILVNTAYLAATRGDGGQNLIGSELTVGLGVIRTQELLAARKIDGGQQFFTRANDFGYSKTADETLQIWNKDQVLSDMVWTIRKFRPDVIITRFPPDSRAGHGHHASSAILAEEAFKLAGNKNAYPEQLAHVTVWQPTRLMINSGRWWDKDIENQPNTIKIDVGSYNSTLGISYTEMAAVSRSQHRSQGFGATHFRGSQFEYLKPVLGTQVEKDLFEGIDLSWERVGSPGLTNQIDLIVKEFNQSFPERSVKQLLALRTNVSNVNDDFWRVKKLKEIDQLVMQCAGLFLEATATHPTVVPGDSLKISLELVNRSNISVQINSIVIEGENRLFSPVTLGNNQKQTKNIELLVASTKKYNSPYWLNENSSIGMYAVENQLLRGRPENDAAFNLKVEAEIDGTKIIYTVPVEYKWTDRVVGESYRPLSIVPPIVSSFDDAVIIFDNGKSQKIGVNLKANQGIAKAVINLSLPKAWRSVPTEIAVDRIPDGASSRVEFEIFPTNSKSTVNEIKINTTIKGHTYHKSMQTIEYEHIPYQVLLPEASAKAVSLHVAVGAKVVGYIMGAGDEVPQALEQMGVKVWLMKESDITPENLATLDAVILGVRALNTKTWLKDKKEVLLGYVEKGGTMVTQYNKTQRFLDWNNFAPYQLTFSGRSSDSRVTEENAEVMITSKESFVVNYPNAITSDDFNGWVQERGLYFPKAWDSNFKAPLAMKDTGEEIHHGSLLVAQYGKGHYVYTGLSFFRELPAGVPGAYRLFANIISLSSNPNSNVQKR
jgi:LmbE family N-acetylglucosaminyl deacetylase